MDISWVGQKLPSLFLKVTAQTVYLKWKLNQKREAVSALSGCTSIFAQKSVKDT